jgi:hypothetical protein
VRALVQLGVKEIDQTAIRATLGLLLKHEGDRALVESKAAAMIPRARQGH